MKSSDTTIYCPVHGGTPIPFANEANAVVRSLVSYPIEGSSFYNRIGRRTRCVSLEVRGFIQPSKGNAAAVDAQLARIIILYDRQPNGAAPTLGTVLTDYDFNGTATTSAQSGLNMDNRDRFVILRDRKLILPPLGVNGVAPTTTSPNVYTTNSDLSDSQMNYCEYIKTQGLETQYKGTGGGTISEVATGAYLILLIAQTDSNGTPAWQLNFTVRQKFLD